MYYGWDEMSYNKFQPFRNSFERDEYESWREEDEFEIEEEAEDNEACLD